MTLTKISKERSLVDSAGLWDTDPALYLGPEHPGCIMGGVVSLLRWLLTQDMVCYLGLKKGCLLSVVLEDILYLSQSKHN